MVIRVGPGEPARKAPSKHAKAVGLDSADTIESGPVRTNQDIERLPGGSVGIQSRCRV